MLVGAFLTPTQYSRSSETRFLEFYTLKGIWTYFKQICIGRKKDKKRKAMEIQSNEKKSADASVGCANGER